MARLRPALAPPLLLTLQGFTRAPSSPATLVPPWTRSRTSAPVRSGHTYFVALTPLTGPRVCPWLTSLPRTESRINAPGRLGGHAPTTDRAPTRPTQPARAPRPKSNVDSPSWGPPPIGDWQDLPQFHAVELSSPSRQEPGRAPCGKDHGKPLEAPVGGEGSRGTTLLPSLPSARGSLGFDFPGQLTPPSILISTTDPQPLPGGMQYGRKFDGSRRRNQPRRPEVAISKRDGGQGMCCDIDCGSRGLSEGSSAMGLMSISGGC